MFIICYSTRGHCDSIEGFVEAPPSGLVQIFLFVTGKTKFGYCPNVYFESRVQHYRGIGATVKTRNTQLFNHIRCIYLVIKL